MRKSRHYVSKRHAEYLGSYYDNMPKKPGLTLKWDSAWGKPRSIKQVQMTGMRKVPITLPKIPESRVLTEDDLK